MFDICIVVDRTKPQIEFNDAEGPGALQVNHGQRGFDQGLEGSVVAAVRPKAPMFDTRIVATEQSPDRIQRRRGTGCPPGE